VRSEVAAAQRSLPRRAVLSYDVWRLRRLEALTVDVCDIVSAITDRDRDQFAASSSDTSFVVVPPGWSGTHRPNRPPSADRPRRVGIMGSFDWEVKREGLRRFLAAADSTFADAGCELVIGGRVPDAFRRSLESDLRATRFIGWVDDPGAFLDSCRLGVISESLGGGFKLKALDYVFNHVPLACLDQCTAGLPLADGVSMFTAADEAALAARVVSVLDDTDRLDQVAEQAYLSSVGVFEWSASAARLVASVDAHRPAEA
jgi:glycosyltransferase involved in cell wall biosynthesis